MIKKKRLMMLNLLFFFLIGCVVNPITGKQELILISEQQDIAIGQSYAPEIEKQMGGRIENLTLQNYIDGIGQKLVAVSHKPYFEYHFLALEDESVNAFAMPGGYIFITKGMLEQLETEAQLASILGHEITHVVTRDTSVVMSREIGIDILLSAVTSEQTPTGVLTATNLTRQILGLGYSRKDERDADIGGLGYMVQVGYNPYAMIETMQMLEQQREGKTIDFFSTHPNPENRIEYIREQIETKYYNLKNLRNGKEDYQKFVLDHLNN